MSTAAAFAVVPARPAVVRRRARDLRTRAGHVSRNGPNDASVRGDDDAATGRRGFISSVAAVAFAAAGVLDAARAPEARAFGGEIALSDVRYEPTACPPNQYVPNKKNTVCLRFTAVATNNLKRKVEAANIFGFVEDKQGNSAVTVNPTGTSRTVLSGLDAPVPPGTSEVSFIVTVFKDSLDLGDLKLRGFKAEPSMSDIEKRFKPFDECEMDPSSEGCDGAF